jgi:hypothetical protein
MIVRRVLVVGIQVLIIDFQLCHLMLLQYRQNHHLRTPWSQLYIVAKPVAEWEDNGGSSQLNNEEDPRAKLAHLVHPTTVLK